MRNHLLPTTIVPTHWPTLTGEGPHARWGSIGIDTYRKQQTHVRTGKPKLLVSTLYIRVQRVANSCIVLHHIKMLWRDLAAAALARGRGETSRALGTRSYLSQQRAHHVCGRW